MDEREHNHEGSPNRTRKVIRPHPKPAAGSVGSLNQAIRQELWFVDTMLASPFRTARRQLQSNRSALAQGADETLWALEGMVRLPIKLIQSAFGENVGKSGAQPPESGGQDRERESDPSPDNR